MYLPEAVQLQMVYYSIYICRCDYMVCIACTPVAERCNSLDALQELGEQGLLPLLKHASASIRVSG